MEGGHQFMSNFDLRPCPLSVVKSLCKKYHGYGGAGGAATYAFAVYEDGRPVAAFAWQPPPPGAAKSVCPERPQAVLALSRMVAVPKSDRRLRHISKPLRYQMRRLIDRGRWPVLITYHDEGQGHTGHVYKCSGWALTHRAHAAVLLDAEGRRASSYSNGKSGSRKLTRQEGGTFICRWEHWACERGQVIRWMFAHGWRRAAVPGKVWKSGNQAYRFVRSCL